MIKFCIITCTYKAENELPRTLESVRKQTYGNIYHIIIDGASPDKTVMIALEYANICNEGVDGHTVKIVSEKDNGLYDAMNKALNLAEGDYILFLNAGDAFADDRTLESIAEQIDCNYNGNLPGVIYGNTDIINEKGVFQKHRRLQPPETLTWKSFQQGMLVCHQAFYARTDLAKKTPYNQLYHFSADVDWCIRIMKKAEEKGLALHNTHLTLCKYLAGGMSIKNHRASLKERFIIMKKHYGLLPTVLFHIWFLVRK